MDLPLEVLARCMPKKSTAMKRVAADETGIKSGSSQAWTVVVSCEHGGNRVPARYKGRFATAGRTLETHRGYDIGALDVARKLATTFEAKLHRAMVTRLVVDLNRSRWHKQLISRYLEDVDSDERRRIMEEHYLPYRGQVEDDIARHIAAGRRVLHVSVHSFTPVLRGNRRRADIGLLYDPARPEAALASRWKTELERVAPELRVRRNYPYLGITDGFQPYLRKRFDAERYQAIEIEMNQKHLRKSARSKRPLARALLTSLRALIAGDRGGR